MSARVYSVVLGCAQAQELRAVLSGPGISIVPNKVSLSLSLSLSPSLSLTRLSVFVSFHFF